MRPCDEKRRATHLELLHSHGLDEDVRAELAVRDGDDIVSHEYTHSDSLDCCNKVELVLDCPLVQQLLAEVVSIRGEAEGFGPL